MASILLNNELHDNSRYNTALEFVASLNQADLLDLVNHELDDHAFFYDLEYGEEFDSDDPRLYHSKASGDDLAQQVGAGLYYLVGLKGVYAILEEAFHETAASDVKKEKQTTIKYKGVVIYEFLQHDRVQSREYYEIDILKITRQLGGGVYGFSERHSHLTLVGQWCIPYGKLQSVLNERNLDFGARFLSKFGIKLQQAMKKQKYRVPLPPAYANRHDTLDFDKKYLATNSPYAGMEQLIGLTLQYDTNTLAQLVKYSIGISKDASGEVDEFVQEFGQELELRAPHKVQLGRTLFENLSAEQQARVGYTPEGANTDVFVDYVPQLMKRWMEYTGVNVTPVVLVGKSATLGEFEEDDGFEEDTVIGENNSNE